MHSLSPRRQMEERWASNAWRRPGVELAGRSRGSRGEAEEQGSRDPGIEEAPRIHAMSAAPRIHAMSTALSDSAAAAVEAEVLRAGAGRTAVAEDARMRKAYHLVCWGPN
ncbi:unnamed protein product [Urochloa humidicola]